MITHLVVDFDVLSVLPGIPFSISTVSDCGWLLAVGQAIVFGICYIVQKGCQSHAIRINTVRSEQKAGCEINLLDIWQVGHFCVGDVADAAFGCVGVEDFVVEQLPIDVVGA